MTWTYLPDLLARPVPRYTSYPTAADFHEGVGAAQMEAALAGLDAGRPISLYLHIPFCDRICWYCGCNTAAANKAERLESFLGAMHDEIDLVANHIPDRMRVAQIAFGGGSPNVISGQAFAGLVSHLDERFDTRDAMLSVEVDPRSLNEEFVVALAGAHVQRASLGVQTFSDDIQRRIGRIQPVALIERAVAALRAAGISSLNFDLMYGLPGQTLANLQATLAQTAALAPDRIALFGYAHVPHLIPRQRRIDDETLPGVEARFEMAAAGYDYLVEAGYQPVGFDHFALPDDPIAKAAATGSLRRNFQGCSDDQAETLIGFGPSAISSFSGLLVQNVKNSGRYHMLTASGHLAAERGIVRTPEDRRRGDIIEALLCRGEAETRTLPDALAPFLAERLIAYDGRTLKLLPGALPYARSIAATFDGRLGEKSRKFSAAV